MLCRLYKVWMARQYPAYYPNTLLLDNALATMGAGVPSAMAAKLVHPEVRGRVSEESRNRTAPVADGDVSQDCPLIHFWCAAQVPVVCVVGDGGCALP